MASWARSIIALLTLCLSPGVFALSPRHPAAVAPRTHAPSKFSHSKLLDIRGGQGDDDVDDDDVDDDDVDDDDVDDADDDDDGDGADDDDDDDGADHDDGDDDDANSTFASSFASSFAPIPVRRTRQLGLALL